MIILGIDPGYARLGYGIVEGRGCQWHAVDFGCLETKKDTPASERLLFLNQALKKIIRKYHPQKLAIEKLFFLKNSKTAIGVGEARGMVLLTAAEAKLPVLEITPLQVKNALTGYGLADKKQVQTMVKNIFCLKKIPEPDDAADALAIAYCGATWTKF